MGNFFENSTMRSEDPEDECPKVKTRSWGPHPCDSWHMFDMRRSERSKKKNNMSFWLLARLQRSQTLHECLRTFGEHNTNDDRSFPGPLDATVC